MNRFFIFVIGVIVGVVSMFVFNGNSSEKDVADTDLPQITIEDAYRTNLDIFSEEDSSPSKGKEADRIDSLTFSNTMEWGEAHLTVMNNKLYFDVPWESEITIKPPPANSSARTKKELELISSFKPLRSGETLKQIIYEATDDPYEVFDNIILKDDFPLSYFMDEEHQNTKDLILKGLNDITVVTMQLKKKFDRVRPSVLDPSLSPPIDVPLHPAYPSGHSTQAHFLALLLGEIFPEEADTFYRSADKIGIRREIAGFHYPSDTAIGAVLADKYLKLLKTNEEFNKLLESAKSEWRYSNLDR